MRRLICIVPFICLLWLFGGGGLYAQDGLQVNKLFRKYGSQRGVTYVELSKNLSREWDINCYKSLKITHAERALPDIYRCLEADKQQAHKIKEIVADGQIQSGYYQLPSLPDGINRFILFRKDKKNAATVIYIEGEIDSEDLVALMFSKEHSIMSGSRE